MVAGNAKLEQLASAHTEGPDNLLAFLRAEHHKIAMVEQRNLLHSTRRMEALLVSSRAEAYCVSQFNM